ncbi:hypothetical protein GPALN_010373 [Globodera pallida]|nr:hypothetical protein GPALN_010373 [Globodera pallida]
MVKVSPADPERYHLRLLLLHVKGACSYDELKTIRNLDGSVKVCTTFAEACLEKGQTVYIPRITLCCAEEYPFDLHRHQFPLVLAFAMTINKAQGQTLERTLAPSCELLEQKMLTMAWTVDFRLWKGIAKANKRTTKQEQAVGRREAQQNGSKSCHGRDSAHQETAAIG